jgi:type II secretory pathway component PulK
MNRGAALITAVALLAIFTMLGVIWFDEMTTDNANTDVTIAETRAQLYANAGVHARLAELHSAMEASTMTLALMAPRTYQFPVYTRDRETGNLALDARYFADVSVSVSDENSRVNINHAPPRVLSRLLGVDGSTARAIRASLPIPGAPGTAQKRWLTSVDELVTRGLLTEQQLADVNPDFITVYTVMDPENPARFINVNSAPNRVLQAVLDLRKTQADAVMEARPFFALEDLVAAAGKEAQLFNTRPPSSSNDGLPPELTFRSTCFRIVAESRLLRSVPNSEPVAEARARVETVIQLEPGGRPRIQYWSESPES